MIENRKGWKDERMDGPNEEEWKKGRKMEVRKMKRQNKKERNKEDERRDRQRRKNKGQKGIK